MPRLTNPLLVCRRTSPWTRTTPRGRPARSSCRWVGGAMQQPRRPRSRHGAAACWDSRPEASAVTTWAFCSRIPPLGSCLVVCVGVCGGWWRELHRWPRSPTASAAAAPPCHPPAGPPRRVPPRRHDCQGADQWRARLRSGHHPARLRRGGCLAAADVPTLGRTGRLGWEFPVCCPLCLRVCCPALSRCNSCLCNARQLQCTFSSAGQASWGGHGRHGPCTP